MATLGAGPPDSRVQTDWTSLCPRGDVSGQKKPKPNRRV